LVDGILLERRGVPAVSICTDKFRTTAVAMAQLHGFPDYQFVTVQHPIASLDLEAVRALAMQSLPQILSIFGVAE